MKDSRFRTKDGVLLNADDEGGPGMPVLFQHGLCGDAKQTREAFPPDRRFRRITLECRGHGLSEAGPAAAFSIKTFAEDIAEFIEESRFGRVVIGGISMGAAIALRLAAMRPDLVRGLILARPAWVSASAPQNMAANALAGSLISAMPAGKAVDAFLATELARRIAAEAPDNLVSLSGFFKRAPLDVTAALLMAISADGPGILEDDISRIKVPTLIIGHGRDLIHPLAHAEALAGLISTSQLVKITAKADDRPRHAFEFQTAMGEFLEKCL
jgi:pimeloyl-ACP methyl ester carboxylesterase